MKTQSAILFASLLFLTAMTGAEPAPLSVAVLGLGAAPDLEAEAEKLTLLLGVNLSTDPEFLLVERVEIDKLLGEQELSLTGTIESATAAKIGHITGAKILVTGRLMTVGAKRTAVAKVIGVETSRVVSVSGEFVNAEGIDVAAKEMSAKIVAMLRDPSATFTAKEESWDEMIARLKKNLPSEAARPTIRVAITEEHISRSVPDPAAQTEVQRVFQELGFPIVKSGPSDYSIKGEAFSERAGQRGQMIFCKARLEVKVTDAKAKKVHVDRQTTAAVDLAENIAGKTALQNAGRAIADRLVTTLFSKTPQ